MWRKDFYLRPNERPTKTHARFGASREAESGALNRAGDAALQAKSSIFLEAGQRLPVGQHPLRPFTAVGIIGTRPPLGCARHG